MNKEETVRCSKCGEHFAEDEVKKVNVPGVLIMLYVCKPCLDKEPGLAKGEVSSDKK